MGMLDGILGQMAGNSNVTDLAARFGLSPQQVETAVQALGIAHPQPGDTVATAASQTGLPPQILSQIVAHLGGENALGPLSSMLAQQGGGGMLGQASSMLDRDGDGNPLNDLAGMASGFFGKK